MKRNLPSRPLPVELMRRQIYILPTALGLVFLTILAGMLVGAVNYNNNLGFLLTFLLGSMAFISIFHTYKNLAGLTIVSGRAQSVFAGEIAVFELFIKSAGNDRFSIRFQLETGEDVTTDIESGRINSLLLSVPTIRRGVLIPESLLVTSRYPLGLFYGWSRFKPDIECLVYPSPIAASFEKGAGASNQVNRSGQQEQSSGVEDFNDLRAYRPGDSMGRIFWKAFSRGRGLVTKTYTGTGGQAVMLDWHLLKDIDAEKRLGLLCHGVLTANQRKQAFGLRIPGVLIEQNTGDLHEKTCLKALALYEENEQ
ncbi:MAG: DUF58 domain-containing protein [Desulfobacteraceae bacterium]|nr:MAG: DUF58 domain-containing protein [Desulfobacteraceae bacterium]